MILKKLIKRIWNSPTLTTWGRFFTKSVGMLLVTPLVLNKFSTEEIAVWFLFLTIIGLGALADIGFMPTFARLTAFAMGGATDLKDFRDNKKNSSSGNPNWGVMERLYSTINLIYIFLTVIAFSLLTFVGTSALRKSIGLIEDNKVVWAAWCIVIAGTSITFYGRKYVAILIGMNYVALINRWEILFNSLAILSNFLVLLLGGGILHLVISSQIIFVLGLIRNWMLLKYVEEGRFKKFKFFKFDRKIFDAAWSPAWRSGIGILGATGVVQATGIIYSQVSDAKSVASYLLALRFMTAVAEVSKAPFYSKVPIFSRLRAEGNISDLATYSGQSMEKALIVFVLGILVVGVAVNPLLAFIKSNAQFVSIELWMAMALVWFLERHHGMHAQIYSTTNNIPFYIPIIISGLLNLFFILMLVNKIGVWTFPLSHGISNLFINNWWNVKISLRSINVSFWEFSKRTLLRPALSFIIACVILQIVWSDFFA